MTDLTANPAGAGEQPAESLEPSGLRMDENRRRWLALPGVALERLPWPYLLTVVVVAGLALGEQLLEYLLEQQALGAPPAMSPMRLVVFPLLVVYILSHLHLLKRAAVSALVELRPIVLVSDEDYEQHVRRMVSAVPRVEFLLLLASIGVVLVLFVGLNADLLNSNRGLPAALPAAIYIVSMYVVLGWVLLSLVYNSIRQGRALDALAHRPLAINAFDQTRLLPFGRLGLIQSLPIVAIVLVPLVLLGTPTQGGYMVIALSVISFLALFVPLWGVHKQIDQAHDRSLSAIYDQLQEIQELLLRGLAADPPNLGALADRTGMLIHLRKTVMEAPSWPFKDSATIARATLAVTSPMVYFILNELIRVFLLPVLAGNRP